MLTGGSRTTEGRESADGRERSEGTGHLMAEFRIV